MGMRIKKITVDYNFGKYFIHIFFNNIKTLVEFYSFSV